MYKLIISSDCSIIISEFELKIYVEIL